LGEYLEGDLALDQRARVDGHLDECEECAREARELRQTVSMLRDLPMDVAPPDVADAVMARIAVGEGRPPRWVGATRHFSRSGGGWALAAGVAALLIVVTLEPVPTLESVVSRAAQGGSDPARISVFDVADPGAGQRFAERDAGGVTVETVQGGRSVEHRPPVVVQVQPATAAPAPGRYGSTRRNAAFAGSGAVLEASPRPTRTLDEEVERLLQKEDSESLARLMSSSLRVRWAALGRGNAAGERRLRSVAPAGAGTSAAGSEGKARGGDAR
jgi:hypothetical protein